MTGYTYNANDQLATETNVAGSFTNKYDVNGSVTNRSSASETNLYSYNLEGRLATATINQQQTNKYYYNQSSIRTRLETFGSVIATNIFLNDPQNLRGFSQVLEELPAVGTTPTVSYTIGSQVIAQKRNGTNSYLMADGHASTRLLTDTNGTISDRYSYDAYVALDFTFGTLTPPRTAMLYSPLKPSTDKPVWIGGDWINCYSLSDPVIHLEIYPPFPSVGEEALGIANAFFMLGFSGDGLTRDSNVDIPHSHYMGHLFNPIAEHGAYWNNDDVLKDLRNDLQ